jgi:hypothetical protein
MRAHLSEYATAKGRCLFFFAPSPLLLKGTND